MKKEAALENIFKLYDRGGSGYITKQQCKDALKSLGYTQDPRDLQPTIGKKDDVLVIAAQKKA